MIYLFYYYTKLQHKMVNFGCNMIISSNNRSDIMTTYLLYLKFNLVLFFIFVLPSKVVTDWHDFRLYCTIHCMSNNEKKLSVRRCYAAEWLHSLFHRHNISTQSNSRVSNTWPASRMQTTTVLCAYLRFESAFWYV